MLPIIKNHAEWSCSGSPYKVPCRNLLMRCKELYEYTLSHEEVGLPFMDAVVLGGPNPNICVKVLGGSDVDASSHAPRNARMPTVQLKPLQNLSLIERNETVNVALKAISCGTFKRNLQPVVCAYQPMCRLQRIRMKMD
jgi:hypothetical protein